MKLNTPVQPLPIARGIYERLPLCLKLLAWHCKPEDEAAFAAYLEGKHQTVSTTATMLWFQDYTGCPEIVNLAAKRDALAGVGLDPAVVTAKVPTHLVFDHSVRTAGTLAHNLADELRLNHGRIRMAKWARNGLGIEVIPPNKGVIHQINFEKLVPVFDKEGRPVFGKGTDSHTPMVNGIGVLAWGVGGGEAQLVFNKEAIEMEIPKVVAINLQGKLRPGVSSADLAFYLKPLMRKIQIPGEKKAGVTGAFVEVIGEGVDTLPVAARGTIANIAAEFGSRTVIFGIDEKTVEFLSLSGREAGVEERAKAYGLWRSQENEFGTVHSQVVDVQLEDVERGINGPDEPHLWTSLAGAQAHVKSVFGKKGVSDGTFTHGEVGEEIPDGALLLASIASCTHTANPDSILRAAIFMKKAAERGLKVKPWVKTAFASGSKVADQYLEALGLVPYIEQMGFAISAHGCGACIGQSGGLNAIGNNLLSQGLKPTSIVSANRNYAGRQDANVSISFLAAPDLIVAYALAGRMDVDITMFDFGDGVSLADLTASDDEVAEALQVINREMHTAAYEGLLQGSPEYEAIEAPTGPLYDWPEDVLVQRPPFFVGLTKEPRPVTGLVGARVLGIFGDNFSTDAISPAGEPIQIPAVMDYLRSQGVTDVNDVLSLGGYRSNDQIVAAMTYGNPTNQNLMVPGKKGGWTVMHPTEEVESIYNAARRYRESGTPLIVIAGKNYGCGSSRVMAATGPWMLGVRAIVAQNFEAIHRANLWQNGIVPLCFGEGQTMETLGLDGSEEWDIPLDEITADTKVIGARVSRPGVNLGVVLTVALESEQEYEFLVHGGAMQRQLREFVALQAP